MKGKKFEYAIERLNDAIKCLTNEIPRWNIDMVKKGLKKEIVELRFAIRVLKNYKKK